MGRGMTVPKERRGRTHTVIAASVGQRSTLPPYQTRTCARCGRMTTFVLEDPAGGWYACVECGHFA
jgi:PHP family Zn ribbon phosphoesterase